jgi:phage baseplate assembly protein gpV
VTTQIMPVLRAVVREELAAARPCELAIVTHVYTNEGGSGDNNLEIDARLRGSAVELQRVPLAVGRLGLSLAPRTGDLVLVAFVGGKLDAPVALGFLYDEQTRPPDAAPDEVVYQVPDDAAGGKRRLEIKLPQDRKITVEDAKLVVTMGSTRITVEADGAIALEAGGDITLKAAGKLSLEAGGEATLKGSSVTVEGSSGATLKGTTTSIKGTIDFSPA